jgi:hypothetical protein
VLYEGRAPEQLFSAKPQGADLVAEQMCQQRASRLKLLRGVSDMCPVGWLAQVQDWLPAERDTSNC